MLLGKRQRPPIKRTTSISGGINITLDVDSHHHHHQQQMVIGDDHVHEPKEGSSSLEYPNNNNNMMMNNGFGGRSGNNNESLIYDYDQRFLANMVSPRNYRTTAAAASPDFMETAHFLRSCGLCNRRLAPGKDIYMYRGDTAFCSLECREEQMKHDERKEKCNVMASKKEDRHASPSTNTKASSKSETVAAA